jgi:hypothetical protein
MAWHGIEPAANEWVLKHMFLKPYCSTFLPMSEAMLHVLPFDLGILDVARIGMISTSVVIAPFESRRHIVVLVCKLGSHIPITINVLVG